MLENTRPIVLLGQGGDVGALAKAVRSPRKEATCGGEADDAMEGLEDRLRRHLAYKSSSEVATAHGAIWRSGPILRRMLRMPGRRARRAQQLGDRTHALLPSWFRASVRFLRGLGAFWELDDLGRRDVALRGRCARAAAVVRLRRWRGRDEAIGAATAAGRLLRRPDGNHLPAHLLGRRPRRYRTAPRGAAAEDLTDATAEAAAAAATAL
mmetsp:Transcript_8204/g.29883  ORF Transcript_8204/g.29883 Transcript_8204/m.29883 type:complete len:210 (+) Transcript_8204:3-632(+)